MAGLRERIKSSRVYCTIIEWLETHSLPGFYGIPILTILSFIRTELRNESIILRANAMAYSFFMALFPAIIVLFTLLAYMPIEGLMQALKNALLQVMPVESATYLTGVIEELASIPRSGLLSVGLLLTLFFTSNGMMSMLRGFEKRHEISYKARTGLKRRLVALQLTVIMGLLLIASLIAIVLGRALTNALLTWTEVDYDAFVLLQYVRWVAIIILFYSGISLLYRYGPALKQRMRFFTPGATLATILSISSSLAFSYYVNQFETYNQFYGSLGALIVLMLWLQINSFIILTGYELNASIIVNRAMRDLDDRD
jgi:membrane protein